MKVVILAGGVGSRLSEETVLKPKPMVEIGGMPILMHIMMYYGQFGHSDFLIALGYKGEVIKKYMVDYCNLSSDLTVRLGTGDVSRHSSNTKDWTVSMIDTGVPTLSGGRIKRLQPYLGTETFLLTWGDGLATVDVNDLIRFHRSHGKLITVTAVHPPARFGALELDGNQVTCFNEKHQLREGWINGAFFVLEPGVFDYIDGDMVQFELEPLKRLAGDGQFMAYRHDGFWQCMDTLRDKVLLEKLWADNCAPWKIWKDGA